ncbi:unnamed protein product [Ilex paraguariensis]|uniref:Uncharacterized protein n=1 Tax=Ilex paraguariensis TaxID=185542 RepID=A0ABC8RYP7_9AQUA
MVFGIDDTRARKSLLVSRRISSLRDRPPPQDHLSISFEELPLLSSQMKFFNWVQNKFNGGPGNRKTNADSATTCHHSKQEPRNEEFSDWPNGLLAIGTFGNNDHLKQNPENQNDLEDNPSSSEDLAEFTPEEVGKLQEELTKLLKRKPISKVEEEIADLPLDKFLNCPSSLEVDRRLSENTLCSTVSDEEDIERTIRVILGRCKEVCMDNKKKAIGKKSVSFLLKKMFVCRGGFAPAPSLRDTFQESRMEKLLRTLLSKNIHPQNYSRPSSSSTKKYLQDNRPKTSEEDERRKKTSDGSKWVKTDSECKSNYSAN